MRVLAHFVLIVLFAAGACAAEERASAVRLDGWIRNAPPGAMVQAGYGRLRNAGPREFALVSARSPEFERVELHEMRMDGGVMRMRKIERLAVDGGKALDLEPGGTHFMLFGPKRPLAPGDRVELILRGATGEEVGASLMVREAR